MIIVSSVLSVVLAAVCQPAPTDPGAHAQPAPSRASAPQPASSAGSDAAAPGDVVLVSTRGDQRVHILALDDLAPVAVVETGIGAHELAVSSDGRYAIGTAYGGPGHGHMPADDQVVVIDLQSRSVARTIDLQPVSRPNDAVFIPGTHEAFVTVEAPPRIVRLNAASGEFVPITLERGANHMHALSADGSMLCIAHVMPGALTILDTKAGTIRGTMDLLAGAEGIAITPDGSRVWVACNRADAVLVVDPAQLRVERTIPCPGFPFRVRVAPDGALVAVSCPQSGDIALYNAKNPDESWRISVRDEANTQLAPTSLAFSADGKSLIVACMGPSPQVVRVDVGTRTIAVRRPAPGPLLDALTCARLGV